MRKMNLIDGDDEIEGYEFVDFVLCSEVIDGYLEIYTAAVCADEKGCLDKYRIDQVRFV